MFHNPLPLAHSLCTKLQNKAHQQSVSLCHLLFFLFFSRPSCWVLQAIPKPASNNRLHRLHQPPVLEASDADNSAILTQPVVYVCLHLGLLVHYMQSTYTRRCTIHPHTDTNTPASIFSNTGHLHPSGLAGLACRCTPSLRLVPPPRCSKRRRPRLGRIRGECLAEGLRHRSTPGGPKLAGCQLQLASRPLRQHNAYNKA